MSSISAPSPAASVAVLAAAGSDTESEWYRICSLDEITPGRAKCSDVAGRPIVIFRTAAAAAGSKQSSAVAAAAPSSSGVSVPSSASSSVLPDGTRLWCLDRVCYHMGGPLDQGDIEDLAGTLVVSCPWHRYKISLAQGEGLYQQAPGSWKSKGVRQRTHETKFDAASSSILVRLNTSAIECASDEYNSPDNYARLQARLAKAPTNYTFNTQSWGANSASGAGAGAGAGGPGQPRSAGPGGVVGVASSSSSSGAGVPNAYQRSGHLFAANRAAAQASKAGKQHSTPETDP